MLALYIIGGVILFVILVLSIPVEMAFDVELRGGLKTKARLGWLFGLVWVDLGGRRGKKPEVKKKPKRKRGPSLSSILKTPLRRLLRLLGQILGCFKIKQLRARLRLGLDDPADTGMMCAFLWPALTPLTSSDSVRFRLEPDFQEPALEGEGHGRVRLFPIQLGWVLLTFILSPTGLRLIKLMVMSS